MAHAKDDHNKADAYHHMAGKERKAHEGSQSKEPSKDGNGQTPEGGPARNQDSYDGAM